MNLKVKRLFQYLMVNDICWFLISPFVFIAHRLEASRNNFKNRTLETINIDLCKKIFKDETILHGIFKGLRYTGVQATGSSVYAKLLGSYELEIAPTLQALLKKKYTNFINIGCDEGYYAVGIATNQPHMNVYAFDCNKKAQENCKLLAQINNVSNSITVMGCFDTEKLTGCDATSKNLFLIDCEGCEHEIFTGKIMDLTKNADLIIELHYQTHPQVLSKLEDLFSQTHRITLITALTDHERVMNYEFKELTKLTYQQKHFILNERDGFMQWFIAEAII